VALRRCVGCGRIRPKPELLRVAAVEGGERGAPRAVLDRLGRMPGRGAYLCRAGEREHPDAGCLALAIKRRGIARALRRPVATDSFSDDVKLVESSGR
jgi:uncharacterized protein